MSVFPADHSSGEQNRRWDSHLAIAIANGQDGDDLCSSLKEEGKERHMG
jgi:hypothetical protein